MIRYFQILFDPFLSFPIRSLSCILKDTVPQILRFLKSHDISNDCKISQNYDFTKKCQFQPQKCHLFVKNYRMRKFVLHFQENLAIFCPKGSRKKIRSFSIRSMIFGSKNPITILQEKMDLRSDHDPQKWGSRSKRIQIQSRSSNLWSKEGDKGGYCPSSQHQCSPSVPPVLTYVLGAQ